MPEITCCSSRLESPVPVDAVACTHAVEPSAMAVLMAMHARPVPWPAPHAPLAWDEDDDEDDDDFVDDDEDLDIGDEEDEDIFEDDEDEDFDEDEEEFDEE